MFPINSNRKIAVRFLKFMHIKSGYVWVYVLPKFFLDYEY